MKTYNIVDIAKLAKVSVSTVSRYFSNTQKLREPNKQRVELVIERTGFYPNLNARALGKLKKKRR